MITKSLKLKRAFCDQNILKITVGFFVTKGHNKNLRGGQKVPNIIEHNLSYVKYQKFS